MKLNNKGFAISSIMYIILILAVILISVTLAILSSRKLILDKIKKETADNIYGISYNSVINILKHEAISYASSNNIEQENIKIGDFETSLSQELLEHHELLDKYLTLYKNNYSYDVYLGQTKKVTDISKPIDNMIGIADYKIEGNSYQATRSGKNLFNINSVTEFYNNTGDKYSSAYSKVEDGVIIAKFGLYGDGVYSNSNITTLEAGTYTLSADVMTNTTYSVYLGYRYYNSEGTQIDANKLINLSEFDTWYRVSYTFTLTDETEIFGFQFQGDGDSSNYTALDVRFKNIQLEKGDTATEYEEYGVMPSPEFPSEIQSVGDLVTEEGTNKGKYQIPIKVTGKNLFDINSAIITGGTLDGNTITSNSTTTHIDLYLKKGTYSITFNRPNNEGTFLRKGQVSNEYFANPASGSVTTFTFEEDEYLRLTYFANGATISNIMLVEGSYTADTMPNYEPYIESVTTNIYLDEPLRKIEDSKDNIDFKQGIVDRTIKKIILDGSYKPSLENWRKSEGYHAVGYPQSTISDSYKTNEIGKILCEQLPNKTYGKLYNNTNPAQGIATSATSSYSIFIRLKTTTITSVDEYLEYLNNNPLTINYVSTSPEPQPITLPNIQTRVGSSMIEVDTSILPSSVEFTIIEKIIKL